MKQEGLTQKALAERMDCTQQYVSKILKGKENMSLDTLSKLEDALGINLIYDEQVAYPNITPCLAPCEVTQERRPGHVMKVKSAHRGTDPL